MRFTTLVMLSAAFVAAVPAPQQAAASGASSGYWMATIERKGTIGYGTDQSYKVFRNVKDYGAVGDGNTDDSAAINKAIADGNRCFYNEETKQACDSSTTTPAIIYFPPGTYQISKPIVMYYYSQLIGDPTNLPIIRAASNFEGLAMLDANPYILNGWGKNWYTNQNNFYRQVRNFVIDMTQLPPNQNGGDYNGIHWQVAQATSLQNIRWEMKKGSGNQHRGLMIENGSGGFMSDLTFNGGTYGMYIGSQQFTTRNVTFNDCETAIFMIWNWLWTFKSINFNNVQVGLNISSLAMDGANQTVGSAVLMDSVFQNTKNAIITSYSKESLPKTGGTFVVYNVDFTGAQNAIVSASGNVILPGGSKIDSWAQGDAFMPGYGAQRIKRAPQQTQSDDCDVELVTETVTATISVTEGSSSNTVSSQVTTTDSSASSQLPESGSSAPVSPTTTTSSAPSSTNTSNSSAGIPGSGSCARSAQAPLFSRVQQVLTKPSMPADLLGSAGDVFQRAKPQYENVPASSFVSVKAKGATGDGQTDDTAKIQQVLNEATADQVVYFDHGAYVITDTILIPKNIRIVGEIWPLIMISGPKFSDATKPAPAFRVGMPGDAGAVEISDLIFETRGPTPGAIMMEWNVADTNQGSSAMWDTHFRVGGTAGTLLQQEQCKNGTKTFVDDCAASFMMMHITQQASAYLENVWFWLADHELDNAPFSQVSIYNGRGILVESQGPTWLWGTASEHNVLYNYQINHAQNVFMAAIQTETPYFQAAPNALEGGFTPNAAYNDPTFADCTTDSCKKAWGLRILESEDIYLFGGGLYSFFEDYTQTCLDTEDCQDNMIEIVCSTAVYLYGLVTKAAVNMITVNGQAAVKQADHTNLFGSTLALFEQL